MCVCVCVYVISFFILDFTVVKMNKNALNIVCLLGGYKKNIRFSKSADSNLLGDKIRNKEAINS